MDIRILLYQCTQIDLAQIFLKSFSTQRLKGYSNQIRASIYISISIHRITLIHWHDSPHKISKIHNPGSINSAQSICIIVWTDSPCTETSLRCSTSRNIRWSSFDRSRCGWSRWYFRSHFFSWSRIASARGTREFWCIVSSIETGLF